MTVQDTGNRMQTSEYVRTDNGDIDLRPGRTNSAGMKGMVAHTSMVEVLILIDGEESLFPRQTSSPSKHWTPSSS